MPGAADAVSETDAPTSTRAASLARRNLYEYYASHLDAAGRAVVAVLLDGERAR